MEAACPVQHENRDVPPSCSQEAGRVCSRRLSQPSWSVTAITRDGAKLVFPAEGLQPLVPQLQRTRTVTEPPSALCSALPVTIFLQIFDGSDAEEPRGPGEGGGKCVGCQPRLPGGWSLLQPENAPVICWGRPLPPAIPDHCQCAEWWQVAQGP